MNMHVTPCQLVNCYEHQDENNAPIFSIYSLKKFATPENVCTIYRWKWLGQWDDSSSNAMQCRDVSGSYETVGWTCLPSCVRFGKKKWLWLQDIMHTKKQHDKKQCSGIQLVVLGQTRKADTTDTFHLKKEVRYRGIYFKGAWRQ